jgi:excisionase family DNA binding protein
MSKLPVPFSHTGINGLADGGSLLRQTPGPPHRDDESRATRSDAARQVGKLCPPQPGALCRLYTIAEISRALQLSDSTIRRAIRLKHLAAIKVGRVVRLTAADVEAWVERLRRKAR